MACAPVAGRASWDCLVSALGWSPWPIMGPHNDSDLGVRGAIYTGFWERDVDQKGF